MAWLRLEKFVFFALLFSIPFQKRIFLFGPGLPKSPEFFEWNSAFLYATDFLVGLLAFLWLVEVLLKIRLFQRFDAKNFSHALPLILLLGFAFLSLTQADLVGVGVYRFIKLAEFVFLFFYAGAKARYFGIQQIFGMFAASGVFQAILAILQFKNQSSLGLEIFHESTLAIGTKGVAQIAAGGVSLIRAYGTFPSPNVLAAFLVICLFFGFALFLQVYEGRLRIVKQGIYGIAIALLSFALLLAFSRGVTIFFFCTASLFFGGIFFAKQFRHVRKQAIRLAFLLISVWLLLVVLLWPEISSRFLGSSFDEPAIQERLFFNEVGLNTVRQNYAHLFLGVGIGNFVHQYMRSFPHLPAHLYQPVHNIIILIASEVGILGLLAFVSFLVAIFRRAIASLFSKTANQEHGLEIYIVLATGCFMLLAGMYDHYFWTIQQGSLAFWVVFGLLANPDKRRAA